MNYCCLYVFNNTERIPNVASVDPEKAGFLCCVVRQKMADIYKVLF